MKKTVVVIFCFCSLLVCGQTIEQQLLSQLHQTGNTSASDNNKWTKIASCTITAAYQDLGGEINFMGTGSGNAQFCYGRIIARFKNQNASPAPVNYYNLLLLNSNLGVDNVKAIRNDTQIDLYIRIPIAYTRVHFWQSLKAFSGALTMHDNQAFLSSLPSGTVIDCADGNAIPGTVSNYAFNSESPVYDAKIIYDATFNDANQLRNIIALRNLTTNGSSTALRQSGIHLSLSHESTSTESGKSAQILLESKNTYANYPSLNFYTKNQQRMTILHDGKVGINTLTPRTQLEVNGTIRATEVNVLALTADYVFNDDYELRPLEKVEQFIKENRHLPDIPSAAQMEENEVIGLAEMNKLLLQKIEELTLYVIEQKKTIDHFNKRIEFLENNQ